MANSFHAKVEMQHVTLEEAKSRLDDLVEAAAQGEEVYITLKNQDTVQLVLRIKRKGIRQFESAKGKFTMMPNFDEPLEDFDSYTKG